MDRATKTPVVLHEELPAPLQLLEADWVFGYGSLIWNPEVAFDEAQLARVYGYHRAFCVQSRVYRGTDHRPGIVLGLNQGGSVTGRAFRLTAADRARSLRRLYAREMLNHIYLPRVLPCYLNDGRQVKALVFVADPGHADYQRLDDEAILERLGCCAGAYGPNRDYAINTLDSLRALGVADRRLAGLVKRLRAQYPA